MLRENTNSLSSLQEEANLYVRPSILDARIGELKASLIEGEKCSEKVSMNVDETCHTFKEDQKSLCYMKRDCINALRSLEEEVVVARHKSRKSLKRAEEALGMVREEMLEQA